MMPEKNADLHGNVPDKSDVALLMVDVVNDLEFPEGDQLFDYALPMARQLADLKRRAVQASVPVIYVNDNFGRWRSDFQAQVNHCLEDWTRGKSIVQLLKPDVDDYFVLKPKHSGFYSTTLDTLLQYLGVSTVILTGIATNICVLFTAQDAYLRDYNLIIPRDCVAANTAEDNRVALEQMQRILKADTRSAREISL